MQYFNKDKNKTFQKCRNYFGLYFGLTYETILQKMYKYSCVLSL